MNKRILVLFLWGCDILYSETFNTTAIEMLKLTWLTPNDYSRF